MKKIIIALALLLVTGITAQEKTAFEKDTYKFVKNTMKPIFSATVEQMASMVKSENKDAFIKDVEATYPKLFDVMTKIYMEEFTHKDIKSIIAFYDTSVGKKMVKKQPILQQKGILAGQTWGIQLQKIMSKHQ